jgi:hypothetical protein
MENHQDNESAERWSQQGQQSMLNDAQIVENRHRIDSSDNWSQQVETDELHRMTSMTSSVIMEDSNGSAGIPSDSILSPSCATSTSLAPKREEPTLKEKLVERERQRRVETERARLKLQFALSGGAIDEDSTEQDEIEVSHGSVAGTAGEGSSVAFLDPYDEEGQKLTYPMERFLQEQGGVIEEEPPPRDTSRDNGVVMERFLKEPVVVAENSQQEAILPAHEDGHDRPLNIDRSVSFDMEPNISGDTNTRSTENDTGPIITAMVDRAVADGPQVAELNHELDSEGVVVPTDSMETQTLSAQESQSIGRSDQPRFLRLTEAEIQEMAAIDDASRSNAPPSERDDISDSSFVGELISDFGVTAIDTAGTFSQGTGTTAMESASGDHSNSGRIMSEHEDGHSIDAAGTASLSSHIVSSAGASVAANPPSELGTDDHPLSPIPSMLEGLNHHEASNEDEAMIDDAGPPLTLQEPGPNEARIVNRQIRPGMFNPHRRRQREGLNSAHGLASTPLRRVASAPDLNEFDVDDFDYDKYAQSPASGLFGMEDPPPDDIWSPGSNLSPGKPTYRDRLGSSPPESPVLGARANEYAGVDNTRLNRQLGFRRGTQLRKDPLLPPIPKQVVASPRRNDTSLSTLDRTDAEEYLQSSRFKRGKNQFGFVSIFCHTYTLASTSHSHFCQHFPNVFLFCPLLCLLRFQFFS